MDDQDRGKFLAILGQVVRRFNWLCHAYCLMGNHYHLLIETPEGNLSAGMRQLNGVYTQAFNRAHNRDGHVFKGRFKAVLVEKQSHLLELCRYVVLNPVAAGMVNRPEEHPWSSYLATLGETPTPPFLTTDWVLGNFSRTPAAARRHYQQFVADGLAKEETPWSQLVGQIFLGSEAFIRQACDIRESQAELGEIPREQRHAGRPSLEELFPADGPLPKPERNRLIRSAHGRYGYRLTEIAKALGIHYTTVSKVINQQENLFFKT
ncbi:transposase [Desulfuromonas versatilis]|uniref:Transposase n=1 Tax=Desulfuromonas versatilis TaxID=2802975 RepID=A0ABN6E295_9BACT|nr:transposase [Desulfuromonas versatilis]